jgi:hypothetical protein
LGLDIHLWQEAQQNTVKFKSGWEELPSLPGPRMFASGTTTYGLRSIPVEYSGAVAAKQRLCLAKLSQVVLLSVRPTKIDIHSIKSRFARLFLFSKEGSKLQDHNQLFARIAALVPSTTPSAMTFNAYDQSSRNWRFFSHRYMSEIAAGDSYYVQKNQFVSHRKPAQEKGLKLVCCAQENGALTPTPALYTADGAREVAQRHGLALGGGGYQFEGRFGPPFGLYAFRGTRYNGMAFFSTNVTNGTTLLDYDMLPGASFDLQYKRYDATTERYRLDAEAVGFKLHKNCLTMTLSQDERYVPTALCPNDPKLSYRADSFVFYRCQDQFKWKRLKFSVVCPSGSSVIPRSAVPWYRKNFPETHSITRGQHEKYHFAIRGDGWRTLWSMTLEQRPGRPQQTGVIEVDVRGQRKLYFEVFTRARDDAEPAIFVSPQLFALHAPAGPSDAKAKLPPHIALEPVEGVPSTKADAGVFTARLSLRSEGSQTPGSRFLKQVVRKDEALTNLQLLEWQQEMINETAELFDVGRVTGKALLEGQVCHYMTHPLVELYGGCYGGSKGLVMWYYAGVRYDGREDDAQRAVVRGYW